MFAAVDTNDTENKVMDAGNEANMEALRTEIEQLRTDISRIEETLKAIVSQRVSATYGRVRDTAERVADQASEAADSLGRQIAERPLTNVATAFGIGILLGMLFGRRQ